MICNSINTVCFFDAINARHITFLIVYINQKIYFILFGKTNKG